MDSAVPDEAASSLSSPSGCDLQRKFEWASLSGANDSIWPISPPSFHRFPIAVPISPPFPTRSFLPRGLDSRYFGIVDQITNCNVKFGSKDEVWQVLSGKCSAQAYNIIPSNHHESSSIREGESGDSPGLGGLDALQSHQLEGAREGPVLAPQDLLNPNIRKLSRCLSSKCGQKR